MCSTCESKKVKLDTVVFSNVLDELFDSLSEQKKRSKILDDEVNEMKEKLNLMK